ncbi:adhesion G-protein coupled receptor G2-like [Clupea harengus]|uniref:Adhesion G-protein coupled receptor G2-like n=1 Tax=Clupea harengus TaxID=7950 RepID=A0A8M1K4Y6_CLUHA|nr:adhesion G-protein coupled receptor G2-like [Clupea harengus]
MFPIMAMLLLIGTTAERDTPTFIYTNSTGFGFSMRECRLHITDDPKNPLSCVKNQTACYVSCSEGGNFNFTSNSSELTVEGNQACDSFYIAGANNTCKLVPCTTNEIKEVLQPLNNPSANLNELKTLLNVKQMCNNLFDDFQFVDFYIGVEERIIHNVLRDLSLANVSLDFDLEDLVMTVTGVNCSRQDHFINVTSPTSVPGYTPVETLIPSVPGYTPVETLIPVEAFINTPAEKQKAAVVRYRSSQQFLVGQDVKLVSTVVRVEVLEPLKQLKTPLRMSFAVNWIDFSPVQNQNFSCQFYNHSALQDDSRWSSDGCTVNTVNTTVECSCDHMTPFAVLLIPGLEGTLDPLHWTILSYISYIGCGLSALFSAIAILSYFIISV